MEIHQRDSFLRVLALLVKHPHIPRVLEPLLRGRVGSPADALMGLRGEPSDGSRPLAPLIAREVVNAARAARNYSQSLVTAPQVVQRLQQAHLISAEMKLNSENLGKVL